MMDWADMPKNTLRNQGIISSMDVTFETKGKGKWLQV